MIGYLLLGGALLAATALPVLALGHDRRRCRKGKHRYQLISLDQRACVHCGITEVRQPCHPADCDPECQGEWLSTCCLKPDRKKPHPPTKR